MWDANGDAAPIRVIRSAPLDAPTTLISNPYMIAFDGRRDEVLVPNCVAQPRIAAYSTSADKGAVPNRILEGQNTKLSRTVHAIAYDDIHDEFVVQSNMGQAVVTYRGGANGNEAPLRIIQGPKTLLRDPVSLFIDAVHNEYFVFNQGTDDLLLVYDRTANGDVAPKRVLKTPGAIGAVLPRPYVGVWSEDDNGDVPPRYTIAKGSLYIPRGLTLDPKKKTVIVSDKLLNSVMTFSLPEIYDRPAASQTARAAK